MTHALSPAVGGEGGLGSEPDGSTPSSGPGRGRLAFRSLRGSRPRTEWQAKAGSLGRGIGGCRMQCDDGVIDCAVIVTMARESMRSWALSLDPATKRFATPTAANLEKGRLCWPGRRWQVLRLRREHLQPDRSSLRPLAARRIGTGVLVVRRPRRLRRPTLPSLVGDSGRRTRGTALASRPR